MRIMIVFSFLLLFLLTRLIEGQPIYSSITYDAGTSVEVQPGADVCATTININGSFSGGGTICTGPLPVTLSSFNASVNRNNVLLSWRTEAELNNSGFKVERMNITDNLWKEAGFVNGNGTTSEPKDYFFEDKKIQTGKYKYRLKQIDFNGGYEYFQLENDVVVVKPAVFSLSQNYPNPSNPRSKIDFEIPVNGKVLIRLYNLLGQEVVEILNESREAGYYSVEFDGTHLASGVYFYRLFVEDGSTKFSKTLKMILVK